jgi:hypothetical protein
VRHAQAEHLGTGFWAVLTAALILPGGLLLLVWLLYKKCFRKLAHDAP